VTGFTIVDGPQVRTFRLPSSSNIFTAESYALYMAVQFTVQSNYKYTLIITDSLSALVSLQDRHSQNEVIQLTKDLISASKNIVKFMWVPSHIGIPGNEKADKMANEVVTLSTFHNHHK
jgi:ribonuclease HI